MADFKIEVAGFVVEVHMLDKKGYKPFWQYITETEAPPDFSVAVTPEMLERENSEGLPENVPPRYREFLAVHRLISSEFLKRGVLMLHGSAVEVDGECFVFTALSGTGKSTHAALWRKVLPRLGHKVVMINDDKPFLSFQNGVPYAHGSPWGGENFLSTNKRSPIKAICLLERDSENRIRRVNAAEILPRLLCQVYKGDTAEELAAALEIFGKITENCKFYILGCNTDDSAAEVSYNYMKEN